MKFATKPVNDASGTLTELERLEQIKQLRGFRRARQEALKKTVLRSLQRANSAAVPPYWVEEGHPKLRLPQFDLTPPPPKHKSKGERKRASAERRQRERRKR